MNKNMSRNLILILGILLIWFMVVRPLNSGNKAEEKPETTGTKEESKEESSNEAEPEKASYVPSRAYTN